MIRSLLPTIEKTGVASLADIDFLAASLRDEPGNESRAYDLPRITGAWARTALKARVRRVQPCRAP